MRVAKAASKIGVLFAPDIDDNRKTREFTVRLRPMSAGTYDHATSAGYEEGAGEAVYANAVRDRIVLECVEEVFGYVAVDPDTGERTEIKTAAQLLAAVKACDDPEELKVLDQIAKAARDRSKLSEGVALESRKPPEPSPPSANTTPGGGANGAGEPKPSDPATPSPSAGGTETATR